MSTNLNFPVSVTTPANGNWDEQKLKLKLKYPELTDDDLSFEEGKRAEMMERVQHKLNKTKAELLQIISTL